MKKQTKQFHHRHHVRVSTLAIALACGFHISGLTHAVQREAGQHAAVVNFSRVLADHMERENETARHMVRFDEGLRLPSISGGNA
jgi:hypothetical protein